YTTLFRSNPSWRMTMENGKAVEERMDAAQVQALIRAEHGDPFAFLGPHQQGDRIIVRTWQPGALEVELLNGQGDSLGFMQEQVPGLFIGQLPERQPYRLRINWSGGIQETEDPYAF